MELSEILGGAPAPVENVSEPASTVETTPVVPDATEPTTTVEQPAQVSLPPRDERGRWVQEPAPVEERQQHTVPVSALIEERRKRQELEARLQLREQPQAPQLKDEDFWQNPVQATQQLVGHQAQEFQTQVQNLKYEIAEDLTRSLHADYDQVRDGFIAKVTEGHPWAVAIAQQMGSQPNPARFVYDQAKKLAAFDSFGDPQAFEARIRAEERARVLTEMQRTPGRTPQAVPQSLNSEPSAAVPSSAQSFEQTPLTNLFERKF
jgi:hypothetical protein